MAEETKVPDVKQPYQTEMVGPLNKQPDIVKLEERLREAVVQIRKHLLTNRDKQVLDGFLWYVNRNTDPAVADAGMPTTVNLNVRHPVTIIYRTIRSAIISLCDYDQTGKCPAHLEKTISRLQAYGIHGWSGYEVQGNIADGFKLERIKK